MRYQGGKTRQSSHIVPFIEHYLRENKCKYPNCTYVEPFVGGGNIFTKVNWPFKVCNDIDQGMIELWMHLYHGGKIPQSSELTKELYDQLREEDLFGQKQRPQWLYALVSHICSYGGKKWGGYAHFNYKRGEDHISEALNSLKKQITNGCFKKSKTKIRFDSCDFKKLDIPDGSVVYCDPPYQDTMGYGSEFDHSIFWEWCRRLTKRGCIVLVSEYTAPDDFECIWVQKKSDGMGTTKSGVKQVVKYEKLFIYDGKND